LEMLSTMSPSTSATGLWIIAGRHGREPSTYPCSRLLLRIGRTWVVIIPGKLHSDLVRQANWQGWYSMTEVTDEPAGYRRSQKRSARSPWQRGGGSNRRCQNLGFYIAASSDRESQDTSTGRPLHL
jgi:hypothetical protein